MLAVLGRRTSINVRKVLWTCDEVGAAHRVEEWGLEPADLRRPEFLALNPNGLVPVLRDGDAVLWESNTIVRYLASTFSRDDLLPNEPLARARVEQWMDWQATELNGAWSYAFRALVRRDPACDDDAQIERSRVAWNAQMTILDAQLQAAGAYVAGSQFTVADIVVGLSVHRWMATPIERPALAHVARYYDRLAQREAFRRHGYGGPA